MTANKFDQILIFTDGACSGNPGKGGYGTVVVYPEGKVKELGGRKEETTNNQMEMMAVIKGLKEVESKNFTDEVLVLTDSTYVIQGITSWIFGWKKRGWKTAAGSDVSNKDLWLELDWIVSKVQEKSKIKWGYVRGHQGTPGNERCDEIAVHFSKSKFVKLYEGSLLNYEIAIHDIPEDISLPKKKDKADSSSISRKGKKAYSYLSYINGKLFIDKTWPECEARVKGRSGVKFKKSISAEDEKDIIFEWTGKR